MSGIKDELFHEVTEETASNGSNKVTIVGIGAVGNLNLALMFDFNVLIDNN